MKDKEGMHLCPSREEHVAFVTAHLEKGSPPGRRRTGSRWRHKPFIWRRPRSNHRREVGACRCASSPPFFFLRGEQDESRNACSWSVKVLISSPIGVYQEWAGAIHIGGCDRTISEMRGLSPKIISENSP
jgi:hypothetical protein